MWRGLLPWSCHRFDEFLFIDLLLSLSSSTFCEFPLLWSPQRFHLMKAMLLSLWFYHEPHLAYHLDCKKLKRPSFIPCLLMVFGILGWLPLENFSRDLASTAPTSKSGSILWHCWISLACSWVHISEIYLQALNILSWHYLTILWLLNKACSCYWCLHGHQPCQTMEFSAPHIILWVCMLSLSCLAVGYLNFYNRYTSKQIGANGDSLTH